MNQTPDEQAIARLAEVLADRQRKLEALTGVHNFVFEDAEQLINATIERCAQVARKLAADRHDLETSRGFVPPATAAAERYWCEEIADAIDALKDKP